METLVAGIFLSVLIMLFVGQSLEITGDSMYPTLKNGERIIVEKVTYKSRQPRGGEIIIFRSLENDRIFLIKRVIAGAGDLIKLTDQGAVIVESTVTWANSNNSGLIPTYGKAESLGILEMYSTSPIPDGYIAVMGDNRYESYDSRIFGLVPLEKVVGKAFVVYWPPTEIRRINGD